MASALSQIEYVVLLMFENRSFDNVLGWLYDSEDPPAQNIPPQSPPTFDGLVEGTYALPLKQGSRVAFLPITKGTCGNGLNVPSKDPYEEYAHVNNQLFGTEEKGEPPPWNGKPPLPAPPAMRGFLQDYSTSLESWDQAAHITQTYTPAQLPVLNGLARAFAVSDAWYSSVPTQTNPNRAFFHCGTSLGREKNSNMLAIEQYDTPTLWNVLPRDVTWAIYYHDLWPVTPLPDDATNYVARPNMCYTRFTFPQIEQVANPNSFQPIDNFYVAAQRGQLPALTFLEPKWGFGMDARVSRPGNDYHPPLNVRSGELFLKRVYDALRSNDAAWQKTLLVITFDEHGGTWDHVGPPWGAKPSGKDVKPVTDRFAFNRFGVRVPTILVSPWVEAGTVFRSETETPYDHTSVIATVLKWKGVDPKTCRLGDRVANAPLFENVLSRASARTDKVVLQEPPADPNDPITITNSTNSKLYLYFGWKTGFGGPVVPHHCDYLPRGQSYTYDTSPNTFSWDYYVQGSYWVGDGVQKPGEKIDTGYTGLSDTWRLLWPDWQLVLHHQEAVVTAPSYQFELTGNDKYGPGSQICIKNDTGSQIYYHLRYHSAHATVIGGEYHGPLKRGEQFTYPSGKDVTAWDYSVDVSVWVGDSVPKPGERIDTEFGVDKEWRFLWSAPRPIEHNQTIRIYQDDPAHPSAVVCCPGGQTSASSAAAVREPAEASPLTGDPSQLTVAPSPLASPPPP